MPTPARTLETDARWLSNGLAEVCAASQVVLDPLPFLRDAKAAHQLLDLAVLTAAFLDRLEADDDLGAPVKIQASALREALADWVPVPDGAGLGVSFGAWVARVMGISESVLAAAPISPEGLGILREQLASALKGQDEAERQLRLARADADHLREQVATLEARP